MFSDRAKIAVASGRGGNGCVSFRREKHVPRGGPDGGDGGAGGDVWMVADPQLRDLSYFTRRIHFKARPGRHGQGARKTGASGEELVVSVPVGTQVWDGEVLLADLREPGQRVMVAAGGAGGRGNTRFVTSTRQAPKFAELGDEGDEHWLTLTLKLMADVGLAGLPNAGKSSLLRRVSNAKPKVADYPFTTTEPLLGVVTAADGEDVFTVADVPGLLEGASKGVGLGREFLAHLERCYLVLHVVDVTGYYGVEPLANFRVILGELEDFPADVGEKPQLVALNKVDVVDETTCSRWREILQAEVERLRHEGHPAFSWLLDDRLPPVEKMVWPISAATGLGLPGLLSHLGRSVRSLREAREARVATPGAVAAAPHTEVWAGEAGPEESRGYVVYRPSGRGASTFSVRREGDRFVVEGEAVARLVRRFDLEDEDAVRYLAERLDRMGVYAGLAAQGAAPGDEVEIDGFIFEYQ